MSDEYLAENQSKAYVHRFQKVNRNHLASYEEIKGILKGLRKENGFYCLSFEIKKDILIPERENLSKNLEKYLGTNVAIMNLENKYYLRKIERGN